MADDLTSRPAELIYDEDFFVWTQLQAEALRRAGEAGALPDYVDWERLSEEIGDLGKRDLRGAESLVSRILEHLYLLETSARDEPRRHWKVEIIAFRTELRRELTRSIRNKLEEGLDELHIEAAAAVAAKLAVLEPDVKPPTSWPRWTLPQVLGESDDPVASA